jgi:hypothetical protein
MKRLDFNDYEFRASSIGTLMTGSFGLTDAQSKELEKLYEKEQSGKPLTEIQANKKIELERKRDEKELSETTKSALQSIFISEKYGRKKIIESKYLKKGTDVEEKSARILSLYDNDLYVIEAERERMRNGMICGTCDIKHYYGDSEGGLIIDVKSSWDLHTFIKSDLTDAYWWQLQCYGELYNADKLKLSYVLVDTPESLIEQEIKREAYKMPFLTESQLKEIGEQIRTNLIFDDIPLQERVRSFEFDFDKEAIERIYERIPYWREYLNALSLKLK